MYIIYILFCIIIFFVEVGQEVDFLLLLFREYDDEFFFIIIHFVVAFISIYKYIIQLLCCDIYKDITTTVFVNFCFYRSNIQGLTIVTQ